MSFLHQAEQQEKRLAMTAKTNSFSPTKVSNSGDYRDDDDWGDAPVKSNVKVNSSGDNWNNNEGWDEEPEKTPTKAEQSLLNKKLNDLLHDVTDEDVEVQRQDPNHPLHSVKTFEQLHLNEALIKGIYGMNFIKPSRIQEKALPALIADPPVNMIAQSQSGTGKTAAFLLTMLTRVVPTEEFCQCLCMAPTFELAKQIGDVCKNMARFMTDVKIGYATREERRDAQNISNCHILIGTPGTIQDWVVRYRYIDPKKIKVFVLDEADVLIDHQTFKDISIRLKKQLSDECQILLFSATFEDPVVEFAQQVVPNPILMRLKRKDLTLDNLLQLFARCETKEQKYEHIRLLFGLFNAAQTMVFCHTRREAAWLTEQLKGENHSVGLLTGELTIEERAEIIHLYRTTKIRILVTTNVMARGIDISTVNLVVNWELPMLPNRGGADMETYLHRIGRAGRFGKVGVGLNLIQGERSLKLLRDIERHYGTTIQEIDIHNSEQLLQIQKKAMKQTVSWPSTN